MGRIKIESVKIAEKRIGKDLPCFIIAEAGVNHNGSLDLAKKLVDAAVEAGADAIKFQTFHADSVVSYSAEKAEYQKNVTSAEESQYEMLKKLELPDSVFWELFEYAEKKGIMFLSTPFDKRSVDLLFQIGIPVFKIPSGEITNIPLIEYIGQKEKPVILSTGMSTLEEIEDAVTVLEKEGSTQIVLLHCTTAYPAPPESVNLSAMNTLRSTFGCPVGYSDHTEGINIPIAAVALGADIIEKHFTLNRNLPGPDHKASLEPGELKAMIRAVRDVEMAMGDGIKVPVEAEMGNSEVVRKSIVAERDIEKGDIIRKEQISVKRPGTGIPPKYYNEIPGKCTKVKIKRGQTLQWEDLE